MYSDQAVSHRGGEWYKNLPSTSTNPPAEKGKETAATFVGLWGVGVGAVGQEEGRQIQRWALT